ncbi:hypothetical protein [Streptomyces olivochromogenes]|nr:hypothetical protein [Streptomyces olivochromogenes]
MHDISGIAVLLGAIGGALSGVAAIVKIVRDIRKDHVTSHNPQD